MLQADEVEQAVVQGPLLLQVVTAAVSGGAHERDDSVERIIIWSTNCKMIAGLPFRATVVLVICYSRVLLSLGTGDVRGDPFIYAHDGRLKAKGHDTR